MTPGWCAATSRTGAALAPSLSRSGWNCSWVKTAAGYCVYKSSGAVHPTIFPQQGPFVRKSTPPSSPHRLVFITHKTSEISCRDAFYPPAWGWSGGSVGASRGHQVPCGSVFGPLSGSRTGAGPSTLWFVTAGPDELAKQLCAAICACRRFLRGVVGGKVNAHHSCYHLGRQRITSARG